MQRPARVYKIKFFKPEKKFAVCTVCFIYCSKNEYETTVFYLMPRLNLLSLVGCHLETFQ